MSKNIFTYVECHILRQLIRQEKERLQKTDATNGITNVDLWLSELSELDEKIHSLTGEVKS